MAIVDQINVIAKTDRTFTLIAKFEQSQEPKDLSAFVGLTDDSLSLYLPGEDNPIILTLNQTDTAGVAEGFLEVVDASAGLAGKVKVTLRDSNTLRQRDGGDMELRIKEGAGPDFELSCVQYPGKLNVKKKLFE